eukprot:12933258-Prorocentrum_lima.AAC.1
MFAAGKDWVDISRETLFPESRFDEPTRLIKVMKSYDIVHECGTSQKLVMVQRQLGTVGMELSSDNIWVVSLPCAREIRDDSAKRGHKIFSQGQTNTDFEPLKSRCYGRAL